MSIRSFQDEQRSALADLRLQVPLLQDDLRLQLNETIEQAFQLAAQDNRSDQSHRYADVENRIPEVDLVFTLDSEGAFAFPPVVPAALSSRSVNFDRALSAAEEFEFQLEDHPQAVVAYGTVLTLAQSSTDSAEAFNALERNYLQLGDLTNAERIRRQLINRPLAFDADGAHVLTLSSLRRARLVNLSPVNGSREDTLAVDESIAVISSWCDQTLAGEIPLHSGTRLAIAEFERILSHYDWIREAVPERRKLQRILARAEFVADFLDLRESAVSRPEGTYLVGLGGGGISRLVVVRTNTDSTAVGISINLDKVASAIMGSPAGSQLAAAGFGISLFDADFSAEFEKHFADGVYVVAPSGSTIHRLTIGIHSQDKPFVFEHYRNRNLLVISGIALLIGAIALGVVVMIRETTREIQTANLRSEFVANVSHELRTPLTSIRMFAETLLLKRYRSEQEQHEYLQIIMRESQRLSRMVGNILDFSRMESGRKSYNFSNCNMGEILTDTLDEFQAFMDEAGFEVCVDIPEDLPDIEADPEALATALANLIGNAVKYSNDRKQIDLSIRHTPNEIVVSVADRGIGIPTGEAKHIFGKYHRAANAASIATGTGLGLALVDGIARSHLGRVTVDQRPGGGSIFRLHLPLERSQK